ncbi:MAG TPA: hypothetical protein DEB06_11815 [Phycisphaerales bacterium]|nr:hypothetical protein [Phycisphaerales bacterium]
MKTSLLLAAGLVAGLSGSAMAATEVQLDVNGLTAVASGTTFNASFTGSLTLSGDANSSLQSVLLDGAAAGGFTGPFAGALLSFAATFSFVGGNISGVGIAVGVDTNADTVIDDTYTTSVVGGVGNIDADAGVPGAWVVTAKTAGGAFNSATFAGVNVSDFFNMLLPGNFINFKINGSAINGSTRTDNDVDIDIFARTQIIPLPSAVGLASVGLFGVAGVRRRRLA